MPPLGREEFNPYPNIEDKRHPGDKHEQKHKDKHEKKHKKHDKD